MIGTTAFLLAKVLRHWRRDPVLDQWWIPRPRRTLREAKEANPGREGGRGGGASGQEMHAITSPQIHKYQKPTVEEEEGCGCIPLSINRPIQNTQI